jgi:type I restriction enzyme, S subunit
MAQALFKSWFVDFDPVIDNALEKGNDIPEALQARAEKRKALTKSPPEGGVSAGRGGRLLNNNPALAALFPSSFEYNETLDKWIPEGWEDNTLGEMIQIQNGFAFKSKDFRSDGVPVLKIKNVKPNRVLYHGIDHVEESLANDKYVVRKGELLITMTGNRYDGTPDSWVGKVAMFDRDEIYLVNQRVAKITTNSALSNEYLLELLSSFDFQLYFINNSTSSGGQANISPDLIKNTHVLIPPISQITEFTKITSETRKKIWENNNQTETLTQLRDTLLPQLISGKVRLPAEVIAKAVVSEEVIEQMN